MAQFTSVIEQGREEPPTDARTPSLLRFAIDVLEGEPQLIDRLWENTRFFKAGLGALGFNTGMSESPITPVIVGDGALAMDLSDRLFREGVLTMGIAFPTVPRGKARVRTIVTATHTRPDDPSTPGVDEAYRTVTLLNTGLGDDDVTIDLRRGRRRVLRGQRRRRGPTSVDPER